MRVFLCWFMGKSEKESGYASNSMDRWHWPQRAVKSVAVDNNLIVLFIHLKQASAEICLILYIHNIKNKNCTLCLHDQKKKNTRKLHARYAAMIIWWWPEANYLTHWLAFFEWAMTNIFSFHVYVYGIWSYIENRTNAQHVHIERHKFCGWRNDVLRTIARKYFHTYSHDEEHLFVLKWINAGISSVDPMCLYKSTYRDAPPLIIVLSKLLYVLYWLNM